MSGAFSSVVGGNGRFSHMTQESVFMVWSMHEASGRGALEGRGEQAGCGEEKGAEGWLDLVAIVTQRWARIASSKRAAEVRVEQYVHEGLDTVKLFMTVSKPLFGVAIKSMKH
jgi:hypothetical protein